MRPLLKRAVHRSVSFYGKGLKKDNSVQWCASEALGFSSYMDFGVGLRVQTNTDPQMQSSPGKAPRAPSIEARSTYFWA